MNLTELCACIPKTIIKPDEAVQVLRASMEATEKVYKTAMLYFSTNDKQEELIRKMIEKKIATLDVKTILWKGSYDGVNYWYFMHSLLIIQGKDNRWGFMAPRNI